MQPLDPCRHWRGTRSFWTQASMRSICPAVTREQSPALPCNSNGDSTSLGQQDRFPEFHVVTRESRCNSRKTMRFPSHREMRPFPTAASQEKSHVHSLNSKWYLTLSMQPKKFPNIPYLLKRNTEFPGTTESEPLLPS